MTKRSPARTALAEAIRLRDAAKVECDAAAVALEQFDEVLWQTQSALYKAQDAVTETKEILEDRLRACAGNEDALLLDAARDGLPSYRDRISNAEAAFAVAEERYRLGKEGRVPLHTRKLVADDALPRHERRVLEAVYEVEQAERLADLLADALATSEVAARKRAVVGHVGRQMDGVLSNTSSAFGLAREVQRYLNGTRYDDAAALAPWLAAREALSRDADAELPTS